jgi:predicted membrane protein
MDATFRYNIDKWKPRFSYVDEGQVWNLTVRQPNQNIKVEADAVNEWDLKFGNMVPMDLSIGIGTGNADIKLTSLDVVSLSIGAGSGDIALDLTGNWYSTFVARTATGSGNINLFVPSHIGVQVSPNIGSGTVAAPGFTEYQGNYNNAAFLTADILILIAVDIGAGDLAIIEIT